jgi:2,4-dienoyl-CoA reductase-like NADH-dependent reductase (Old Yellow Enzyme family)/NADPH-dependent 2,4-dienoyl-CoA reductase/sulfur reductase-like enzyme
LATLWARRSLDDMTDRYPNVFRPIQIGPVAIPNRFFLPAHGVPMVKRGPGGVSVPSDAFVEYYAERAAGGAGLLIHSVSVPPLVTTLASPAHPDAIPSYSKVADAVHEHGAKLFAQLHYSALTGGSWEGGGTQLPTFGASPYQRFEHYGTCREISKAEIACLVEGFERCARNLREAGYDGIQIHVAHGVLLEQFLSPYFNRRTDEYGGDLIGRMRLVMEVLERVADAVRPQLALGVRLNCDEMLPGGLTQDDIRDVLGRMVSSELIDFADLDIAVEPQQAPLMTTPWFIEPLHMASFVGGVRDAGAGVVIMSALGRVTDLDTAEEMIANGTTDMVGSARGLIAEPNLVKNAREGHPERSRTCTACNYCISALMSASAPYGCTINPSTAREYKWGERNLQPAARPGKVVVVGGGPAGLEAARVAAMRGHRVVLLERRAQLGGQLRLWAEIPQREVHNGTIAWYEQRLVELGVTVRLGVDATAEVIGAEQPDTVIVATGSTYARNGESGFSLEPIQGWDSPNVYTPEQVLEEGARPKGRVVVLDEEGFDVGVGLAQVLAADGARVTLVTRQMQLAPHLYFSLQLPFVLPLLKNLDVEIHTQCFIGSIEPGKVVIFDIFTNGEVILDNVDAVVLATGRRANTPDLLAELEQFTPTTYAIGDALAPRGLVEATYEGHRFARLAGDDNAPTTMAQALFARGSV